MAKLKVQLSELAMEMEAAVAAADFLKAHDKKVAIGRLEEEVRVLEGGQQEEEGDVSSTASPISQGKSTIECDHNDIFMLSTFGFQLVSSLS